MRPCRMNVAPHLVRGRCGHLHHSSRLTDAAEFRIARTNAPVRAPRNATGTATGSSRPPPRPRPEDPQVEGREP